MPPTKTAARKIAVPVKKPVKRKPNYDRMTDAQKRVAIAKDVIFTLMLPKRYRPNIQRGTYFEIEKMDRLNGKQLKPILVKPSALPGCTVCAKGAMFLSRVRLFNEYTIDTEGESCLELGDDKIMETVKEFNNAQLDAIEYAFESWNFLSWSNLIPDPRERMLAICKNIVKNKGTFLIDQRPKAKK